MSTLTLGRFLPLGKPREAAVDWRTERLERAREDIYRLLAYATESGREIEADVLRESVEIARTESRQMSGEQEQMLWHMRATLSGLVQPAQASGLNLLEKLISHASNGEAKTLRGWSGRWLVAAIVIVAAVHMYTLLGGRLVDDTAVKLVQAGSLSQRLKSQTPQTIARQLEGNASPNGSPATAGYAPDGSPMIPDLPLGTGEATGMTENVRVILDRQRELLSSWNAVWRLPLTLLHIEGAQASALPVRELRMLDAPTDQSPSARVADWMHDLAQDLDRTASTPLDVERYAADLARRVLMEYVLPMLYGALGAFVFVVRLVTSDIDRGSIRMLLNIRYRARLLLGAIFGLTVAMLTSEQAPFMNSIPLSAVALSFLAGYGVEAAFGLLDLLINRIREMGITLTRSDQGTAG